MTSACMFLGSTGFQPLPGPSVVTTPGANAITIPHGAISVEIVCAGPSAIGGSGAAGNLDHGGGGGGTGGVSLLTLSLSSADWGKIISFTVGGSSGFSGTNSSVTYLGTNLVGTAGSGGENATTTSNGSGGLPGSASGGTTNTPGNTGSNGSTVGGGPGAAAPSGGAGPGGHGGYGFGSSGGPGVNGFVSFTWS